MLVGHSFCFSDPRKPCHYALSLHDALPIFARCSNKNDRIAIVRERGTRVQVRSGRNSHDGCGDRKSTRLNSSHVEISYAAFCLKKKNESPTRASTPSTAPDFDPQTPTSTHH